VTHLRLSVLVHFERGISRAVLYSSLPLRRHSPPATHNTQDRSEDDPFYAIFRAASSKVNGKSLNESGFLLLEQEWKRKEFLTRTQNIDGSVVIGGIINDTHMNILFQNE
jgi:NAD-dependent SIR2 family protein deacetylase